MKFRLQRYPTRFPVALTAGSGASRAMVTSISVSGAQVTVEPAPIAGQDCTLEYAGVRIRGEVRWGRDGRAGIKFDRQLSRLDLDRIRFGVQGRHSPRRPQSGFGVMR